MLLGKRPRPPMKRTTSMSEITFDLNTSSDAPPLSPHNPFHRHRAPPGAAARGGGTGGPLKPPGGFNNGSDPRVSMAPTNYRRHSADFTNTPDFLRSCSLCKRPLIPSRDIYMYRGDSAFCSLECRQHAMNQDERKEKFSVASKKKVVAPSAGSQVTSKGETVAALYDQLTAMDAITSYL